MNLIEQIQYEHKLALDHVRILAQSTPEISKSIIEKVIDLEHVDDYYAAKIADILPMHPDDVRSIFARERFSLCISNCCHLNHKLSQFSSFSGASR